MRSTDVLQPILDHPPTEMSDEQPREREARHATDRCGVWTISADFYGPNPKYASYGAHVDLHAFARIDGAMCSFQMGLPLAAAERLYELLGEVLRAPIPMLCLICGSEEHTYPECPTEAKPATKDDVVATRTQAIALQIEDQCDADD